MIILLIHKNLGEAILMSTHNIGFYEDLTKIIFELSNIIKYAPYFYCCSTVAVPEEIRGVISPNSGFPNFEDC